MKTFADIVKLCKGEQGKVFIMDEAGELQLVVLSAGEYEKLKFSAPPVEVDPEVVNAKIAEAKLLGAASQGTNPYPAAKPPRVATHPLPDLREEVIDPSFDFDTPEDL
jgi:hypothetical protein